MNSPKTFRRQLLSRPLLAAVMVIITRLYVPLAPAKGCPVDTDSELPILSRVSQVRELPRDRAALGYRVRLRGLVTYYDPEWSILFVQDSTGGIYVYPKGIALSLRPGQQVEIEGFTEFGKTNPIVVEPRVRVLGHASLPEPKRVSINHLITGSEDSQWVETDAVVRSVTEIWGQYLQLDLASGGGRLKALISNVRGVDPARFVDAKVRVRGVCGTEFDEKQQPSGFLLYVPDLRLVNVLEQPPPDPFGVQAYSMAGLAQLPANPTFTRRVKVQGVVTLQRPGRLLAIRMETGGLLVETQQTTSVRPGDRVEVVGFPAGAGRQPLLQDAIFRRVGTSAPPLPVQLTTKELLGGSHDAELVQIEARLLDRKLTSAEQVLVLQAGDLILNAQLEDSKALPKLASLREGSVLHVSGVCVSGPGQRRERLSLTMLLRSPDDVVVLKVPSWWTLRRAVWVLGCLVVVSLFALLWVAGLRRRVREQTAFIGEQLGREEALKKHYLDIFENVHEVIFIHDLEGRITACNRAGAALTGYSRAEILRMKISEVMSAGYVELTREMTTGKRPGISKTTFEVEIITKDGRRVPIEVSARLMKREGEVTRVLGVARDISERKRAEEALRYSEKRFRLLFERAPLSYQSLDENGCFMDVNPAWLALFGYRHEEVIGRWFGDLMTPESAEAVKKNFPRFKAAGEIYGLEYEMVRKDGSHFIASVNGKIGYDEQGRFTQTHCILADITERKQAEAALRQSKESFEALAENASDGILIGTGEEGRHVYANRRAVEITGYPIEELLKTCMRDICRADELPKLAERYKKRLEGLEVPKPYETAVLNKDGIEVPIEISASKTIWQNQLADMVIFRDITERHRAGEQLRYQATLLASVNDAIVASDAQYRLTAWNEAAESVYGWRAEEVLGRNGPEILRTEWFGVDADRMRRTIAETGHWRGEVTQTRKDGTRIPVELSSILLRDESGRITGYVSVNRDITERKRAEERIQSLSRFRAENPSPILRLQPDGTLIYANPSARSLLQRWGCEVGQRVPADWARLVADSMASGAGKEVEVACDERVYSLVLAPIQTAGYVNAYGLDITERKRAEEALHAISERLKYLLASTSVALYTARTSGPYGPTSITENVRGMLGYRPEELIASSSFWIDHVHPEDRQRILTELPRLEGGICTYEYRFQHKDGTYRWMRDEMRLMTDAHGNPAEIVGYWIDITERKQAEEARRESEKRFRSLVENAPVGIYRTTPDGRVLMANPTLVTMLGYDSFQELASRNLESESVEPSYPRSAFRERIEHDGEVKGLEDVWTRRDGSPIAVRESARVVRASDGRVLYYEGIVEDITERKRAEESMRQLSGRLLRLQDEERRRIARELHDTTAQSLAALAINLSRVKRSAISSDPTASGYLNESLELAEQCSREVRTLSYLLHPPLLEEAGLASTLQWYARGFAQRSGIKVQLEIPPKFGRLPDNVELALYRIVQECLTNVHTHSQSQTACIRLTRDPHQIVLTVADAGCGFPPRVLKRATAYAPELGVGIPGMRERMRELGGRLEVSSGRQGTTVTAILPLR